MKAPAAPPRPHVAGIVAALTSVAGVLLEVIPTVQGHVPPKYAWIVLVVGVICQALTKGVSHGNTVLISRDDAIAHGDTMLISRDEAVAVGFVKPKKEK